MQVKNFYWYVLNKPLPAGNALDEKLSSKPFEPCLSQQLSSQGWVSAVDSGERVYEAHGAQLLMLKQEKRLLPASVVNEHLQVKVEEFEQAEGYKPSRKIRQQMKDQPIDALFVFFSPDFAKDAVILSKKRLFLVVSFMFLF